MCNGRMRTAIAVVGRVVVQRTRRDLDDDLEVLVQTGRDVRIIKLFELNHRDKSGRSSHAIESEYQFLIRTAGLGRRFSRLYRF